MEQWSGEVRLGEGNLRADVSDEDVSTVGGTWHEPWPWRIARSWSSEFQRYKSLAGLGRVRELYGIHKLAPVVWLYSKYCWRLDIYIYFGGGVLRRSNVRKWSVTNVFWILGESNLVTFEKFSTDLLLDGDEWESDEGGKFLCFERAALFLLRELFLFSLSFLFFFLVFFSLHSVARRWRHGPFFCFLCN